MNMADDASEIFCNYELARRPADEFHHDPGHGTVHFRNVDELHTTAGDTIKTHYLLGVASRIRDDLDVDVLNEIPGLAERIEQAFGADAVQGLREPHE
jgi:hypothetical protein